MDGETIDCFRAIVSDVFVPVLKEQAGWGKNTQQETTEFLHLATKFSSVLNEAVMSIHSGLELPMPDAQVRARTAGCARLHLRTQPADAPPPRPRPAVHGRGAEALRVHQGRGQPGAGGEPGERAQGLV